jgi:hypothetical protein
MKKVAITHCRCLLVRQFTTIRKKVNAFGINPKKDWGMDPSHPVITPEIMTALHIPRSAYVCGIVNTVDRWIPCSEATNARAARIISI